MLSESSESGLSEDDTVRASQSSQDSAEVIMLKKRLQRKMNTIKKLKARNEKLDRNTDIWRNLNVKMQQKCRGRKGNFIIISCFLWKIY